jgi:hypothetical protein
MQSLDTSVLSAKTELVARGVFTSNVVREPFSPLDDIALSQLNRFIAARIGNT